MKSLQTIETRKKTGKWFYLFRVPPQKELRAATILKDCGYELVVPVEMKWRRRSRHWKAKRKIAYPMLCGYVLLGFEGEPPWHELVLPPTGSDTVEGHQLRKSKFHFLRPVVIDKSPLCVPERKLVSFLEFMREEGGRLFQDADVFAKQKSNGEFRVGDLVEITDDSFAGIQARVVSLSVDKARVLMPFLNREMEVEVPVDGVVRAA
ncbi:MAG: transcription termination/antitermination NusG family protein [Pseudomonadota bacterium]